MPTDKQFADAFAGLWTKSSDLNLQPARLGLWDGSAYIFDPPGRPGYKYISLGAEGEMGPTQAIDKVGVVDADWQFIRVRRENGVYVIREAEQAAGGGGGSGATNLDQLIDVTINAPTQGQFIVFDSSGQWVNTTGGAGMAAHDINGAFHTGLLEWSKVNKAGSSLGDLADKNHSDLDGITSDQHHARVHDIIGGDYLDPSPVHTVTGNMWQVVGLPADNTLGLLTPTNDPKATARLLRTDATGSIKFDTDLLTIDASNDAIVGRGNVIYIDADNKGVGINIVPSGAGLDVRAPSTTEHTQVLQQIAGQTGRLWRVENVAGDELIVMDSQGNLQSGKPGFFSGMNGWQITHDGDAEFNNIWARGELHATVFVRDEVHAIGGTMLLASAGKLHEDFTLSTAPMTIPFEMDYQGSLHPLDAVTSIGTLPIEVTIVGNYIDIEDPPSGTGFYFQRHDILRVKTEVATGVTDLWLEVISMTQMNGFSRYVVDYKAGSTQTVPKGAAIVDWGQEGDGRIIMTSEGHYGPYIDVYTVGKEPWHYDEDANTSSFGQAAVPHVRMGQLMGVGLPFTSGIDQHGIIMGQNLSDANSPFVLASSLGVTLFKTDIRLHNGTFLTGWWQSDGNFYAGRNVGQFSETTFRVKTTGTDEGDVIIGDQDVENPNAKGFVWWDHSTDTLKVKGDIIIQPGSQSPYLPTQDWMDWQTSEYNVFTSTTTAELGSLDSDLTTVEGGLTVVQTGLGQTNNIVSGNPNNPAANGGLNKDVGDLDDQMNDPTTGVWNRLTALEGGVSGLPTDQTVTDARIAAQLYGEQRRLMSVTGQFNRPDWNRITWQGGAPSQSNQYGFYFDMADGNRYTINTGGQLPNMQAGATYYLYFDLPATVSDPPSQVAQAVTFGAELSQLGWGANRILVGIATAGQPAVATTPTHGPQDYIAPSITIWAGGTYISGDKIYTGSIRTAQLAAGAITAGQIAADVITAREIVGNSITANEIAVGTITATEIYGETLAVISAYTGDLFVTGSIEIGVPPGGQSPGGTQLTPGNIHGGKASYQDSAPGFWLGYDPNDSRYKFDIGQGSSYLRWDGNNLDIVVNEPLSLYLPSGNGNVFEFRENIGSSTYMSYSRPANAYNVPWLTYSGGGIRADHLRTGTLEVNGNVIQLQNSLPVSQHSQAGNVGEIAWGNDGQGNFCLFLHTGARWVRFIADTANFP